MRESTRTRTVEPLIGEAEPRRRSKSFHPVVTTSMSRSDLLGKWYWSAPFDTPAWVAMSLSPALSPRSAKSTAALSRTLDIVASLRCRWVRRATAETLTAVASISGTIQSGWLECAEEGGALSAHPGSGSAACATNRSIASWRAFDEDIAALLGVVFTESDGVGTGARSEELAQRLL